MAGFSPADLGLPLTPLPSLFSRRGARPLFLPLRPQEVPRPGVNSPGTKEAYLREICVSLAVGQVEWQRKSPGNLVAGHWPWGFRASSVTVDKGLTSGALVSCL